MNITINGTACFAEEGSTILDAAKKAGIYIPTLCHLKEVNEEGICRMCVVRVAGAPRLQAACTTRVFEGMEVCTEDEEIIRSRRMTLDLLCRNHRMECEYCTRYTDCRLHELLVENGMDDRPYLSAYREAQEDHSSPVLVRDAAKCVQCRRCVAVCAKSTICAIGAFGRGEMTVIGSGIPMTETECVECGACAAVCPTGALSVRNDVQKVWNLIRVDRKHMIAVVSPDIPKPLGRYLHEEAGAAERLSAFLRAMGFERVYMLPRPAETAPRGRVPNVCPAAGKFLHSRYPQFAARLSGTVSPERRAAEQGREAYCGETGTSRGNVAAVLITPCISQKEEKNGFDVVLSPRELVVLLNQGSVSKFTMLKLWRELTPAPLDTLEKENTERGENALCGLDALDSLLRSVEDAEDTTFPAAYACPGGCGSMAFLMLGEEV